MVTLKTIHLVIGGALVALGVLFILARARLTYRLGRYVRTVGLVLGAFLGFVFAGLTMWTLRLPVLRGSMWSLKDTLVKAFAITTGVLFLLTLLLALLPWVLDRLEHGRFESFVSARHVRSQKSGFLTVISVLSICGVAVSACAQSSVVSVMGGFSQDLRRKILGNNAHIVIDTESQDTWSGSEEVIARVRAVPGVAAATPVISGEVMISSPSNLAGVIVRGVDPSSIGAVIELVNNIEVGSFAYLEDSEKLRHLPPDEVIGMGPGGERYTKGTDVLPLEGDDPDPLLRLDPAVKEAIATLPPRPGLIVGRELAKTLHVYVGDEVTLVSPLGDPGPMGLMPRTRKFRIAAIFFSGMYEYDASYVYTLLDVAEDYFSAPGKISAIDVKVDDAERADRLTPLVMEAVGRPDLRVRDWREINKNLFGALTLERFATFVILSVLTVVASFCIICTLLLMVTEKGKEIAILKALGASDGAILRTFMTEGIIIGAIGTAFGVATGLAMCTGLAWFGLRLDPDVYYIDRLPISVSAVDFVIVAVSAMTICTLATIYPAQAASKLRPVDGLRYE
jgi:lipoprotein-releasing system permease protein